MSQLTGQGMINDALTMIQDQTPTLRAKMLSWLNIGVQELATDRPWLWLNNTATITPVNNVIPKPADYGEFNFINLPNQTVFEDRNQLTPGEAAQADANGPGYAIPVGYTEELTTITLHGAGWTTPLILGYVIEPSMVTDDATPTVWPLKCRAFFQRYILDCYYELDMDERKGISLDRYRYEISQLKQWDNKQKAKTQYSRRGYRRTR